MNITLAIKKVKAGKGVAVPKIIALKDIRKYPRINYKTIVGKLNLELLLTDWVVLPEYCQSVGGVIIKRFNKNHPLLEVPSRGYLSSSADRFIKNFCPEIVNVVIVAYRGKRIIGFSRFHKNRNSYRDGGTWVEAGHRRLGLATKMIQKLEKYNKPIELIVINKSGLKVAQKIEQQIKNKIRINDLT